MKKLLSILTLLFVFTIAANAQSAATTMTGSTDTVVDTGTKTLAQKFTVAHASVSFQVVVTKISGTVAGTAVMQASNDGVNYVSIAVADTLTNVTTNSFVYTYTGNPYLHYRVLVTGSGTMAAKVNGYAITRSNK